MSCNNLGHFPFNSEKLSVITSVNFFLLLLFSLRSPCYQYTEGNTIVSCLIYALLVAHICCLPHPSLGPGTVVFLMFQLLMISPFSIQAALRGSSKFLFLNHASNFWSHPCLKFSLYFFYQFFSVMWYYLPSLVNIQREALWIRTPLKACCWSWVALPSYLLDPQESLNGHSITLSQHTQSLCRNLLCRQDYYRSWTQRSPASFPAECLGLRHDPSLPTCILTF